MIEGLRGILKKSARGRLLAGAGVAAMIGVPVIVNGLNDNATFDPGDLYVKADATQFYYADLVFENTPAALSDLFAREAATLSGVKSVMGYDGIGHDMARMLEISRTHSWALVEYLEDLKAQCEGPLADDCAIEIKEKVLGVFNGYDASENLKHYDTVRLSKFEAMLKADPIVKDMVQNWWQWDVVSRRAGVEHVVDLLSRAFSDEDVSFSGARIEVKDIPNATMGAYYMSHRSDLSYDPHIVFRADDLARMDFKTAMNLAVHEGGHHLRRQMMFMLKNQQFDRFFLKHEIRHDIRLLEIAAYELPVQYLRLTEVGVAHWHGMNPAEKDVITMAAKTDKMFAQMTFEVANVTQAHHKDAPANKKVNVPFPATAPSWRN